MAQRFSANEQDQTCRELQSHIQALEQQLYMRDIQHKQQVSMHHTNESTTVQQRSTSNLSHSNELLQVIAQLEAKIQALEEEAA